MPSSAVNPSTSTPESRNPTHTSQNTIRLTSVSAGGRSAVLSTAPTPMRSHPWLKRSQMSSQRTAHLSAHAITQPTATMLTVIRMRGSSIATVSTKFTLA